MEPKITQYYIKNKKNSVQDNIIGRGNGRKNTICTTMEYALDVLKLDAIIYEITKKIIL